MPCLVQREPSGKPVNRVVWQRLLKDRDRAKEVPCPQPSRQLGEDGFKHCLDSSSFLRWLTLPCPIGGGGGWGRLTVQSKDQAPKVRCCTAWALYWVLPWTAEGQQALLIYSTAQWNKPMGLILLSHLATPENLNQCSLKNALKVNPGYSMQNLHITSYILV